MRNAAILYFTSYGYQHIIVYVTVANVMTGFWNDFRLIGLCIISSSFSRHFHHTQQQKLLFYSLYHLKRNSFLSNIAPSLSKYLGTYPQYNLIGLKVY